MAWPIAMNSKFEAMSICKIVKPHNVKIVKTVDGNLRPNASQSLIFQYLTKILTANGAYTAR